MKLRTAILTTFLACSFTLGAHADSEIPETTVAATPEQVIQWFQNILMGKMGAMMKSSSPGITVFETVPKLAPYWEQVKTSFFVDPHNVGSGQSVERITINTFPGGKAGTTRVLMYEEHIMDIGTPVQRNYHYKPGSAEYEASMKALNLMRHDVELAQYEETSQKDKEKIPSKPTLVDYPAGFKPGVKY